MIRKGELELFLNTCEGEVKWDFLSLLEFTGKNTKWPDHSRARHRVLLGAPQDGKKRLAIFVHAKVDGEIGVFRSCRNSSSLEFGEYY